MYPSQTVISRTIVYFETSLEGALVERQGWGWRDGNLGSYLKCVAAGHQHVTVCRGVKDRVIQLYIYNPHAQIRLHICFVRRQSSKFTCSLALQC
jgi:hypothetical protein